MSVNNITTKHKEIINEVMRLISEGVYPSVYRINLNTGIHKKTIKKYIKRIL